MNYEVISLEEQLLAVRQQLLDLEREYKNTVQPLAKKANELTNKLYEARRRRYMHLLGKAVLYQDKPYLVRDVDDEGWLTLVDSMGNTTRDEAEVDEVTVLGVLGE